jgi:hypothetical protein
LQIPAFLIPDFKSFRVPRSVPRLPCIFNYYKSIPSPEGVQTNACV